MNPACACGMDPYETARGLSDWCGGDDPPLEKARGDGCEREIGDCEDLGGCAAAFAAMSVDTANREDESGDGAALT